MVVEPPTDAGKRADGVDGTNFSSVALAGSGTIRSALNLTSSLKCRMSLGKNLLEVELLLVGELTIRNLVFCSNQRTASFFLCWR
jgi:hypothetical protein